MPNFSGVWNLKEQIQAIAAGRWTGIVTGELYGWGLNSSGQVGDETVVSKSSPVQVGALTNWAQVSAGDRSLHAAAIKLDGTLWTWGSNGSGRLGQGDVVSRSSPVQVGALTNWAQVSANNAHTVSVTTAGEFYAWGRNSGLEAGQLGDGTTIDRSSPVQVGALTNWSQGAAGASFVVALKTDGTLWSWGRNNNGQLGQNIATTVFRSSPVQVGALANWAQVATGDQHTTAVKTDGTLWTWGRNDDGRGGDGTVIDRSSPVQVGALTNWAQVSGGAQHTAAVTTSGELYAWGTSTFGQLGDGTTVSKSSPVQIGALTNWSQVLAGRFHTASIKTDGTLWTWGRSNQGQLGQGTVVDLSSPVQVGALTNWSQVATGDQHTLAIVQETTN